jgi:Family of unknown function (DUF5677)
VQLTGDTLGCVKTAKSEAGELRVYLEAMRSAIQDTAIYARSAERHIFDAVTFGLLSKVFSLADAIALLVENQHPEEGFGLVRTLFECTLNLRYLTRDPAQYESRALRFAQFHFFEGGYWLHQMLEYFKDHPAMIAKLEANAREQSITADPKRPKHWSGMNKDFTWRVAIDDHPLDGAHFTVRQRQVEYETGFFRTSPYVHGSHEAVDGFYSDGGAVFVPRFHSKRDGGVEARAACWMVISHVHQATRYTLFGAGIRNMDAVYKVFEQSCKRSGFLPGAKGTQGK